jgi:hypothetical protein
MSYNTTSAIGNVVSQSIHLWKIAFADAAERQTNQIDKSSAYAHIQTRNTFWRVQRLSFISFKKLTTLYSTPFFIRWRLNHPKSFFSTSPRQILRCPAGSNLLLNQQPSENCLKILNIFTGDQPSHSWLSPQVATKSFTAYSQLTRDRPVVSRTMLSPPGTRCLWRLRLSFLVRSSKRSSKGGCLNWLMAINAAFGGVFFVFFSVVSVIFLSAIEAFKAILALYKYN